MSRLSTDIHRDILALYSEVDGRTVTPVNAAISTAAAAAARQGRVQNRPDIESVGDESSMLCAANTGRVDSGTFRVAAATCYHRALTNILERRTQFTSWERHQVKMTVLAVLYTKALRLHLL